MSLAARLLAGLVSLLVAFGAGWGAAIKYRKGKQAQEALNTSEALRESERLAARNMTRIGDELTQSKIRTERGANALRNRMRDASGSYRCEASGAAERSDQATTAAGVLPRDIADDLVSLMESAEASAEGLRVMQAAFAECKRIAER